MYLRFSLFADISGPPSAVKVFSRDLMGFANNFKSQILKYKVILDDSCFSVPASVRPKQGNTPNNSRKFYFTILKMHIFQYFLKYCQIHWFSLDLVKSM